MCTNFSIFSKNCVYVHMRGLARTNLILAIMPIVAKFAKIAKIN